MDPQNDQINKLSFPLTGINDDCFYKIFEYLSASDLCSTSFTCKRLQSLTQEYFHQKHPKEWITIDINLNVWGGTELEFSKTDPNKILKYFGKSIQNVRMQCPISKRGKINLALLHRFLKNECCEQFHSIELNLGSAIQLNSIAEDEINMQFHSVKSVKVIDVECVHSTYNGLLRLCSNMNSLEIATPADNVYDWLQYVYPNLETLTLPWVHRQNPESIHDFLQNHQRLKDITCEGIHLCNPRFRNFENIHRLVFRAPCVDEFINIIQQLKNNNAQKSIKFFGFELGIYDGQIRSLINSLNNMQSINKLKYEANSSSFQIPYLEHLHKLSVNVDVRLNEQFLNNISENAPNLKSLEISYLPNYKMNFSDLKLNMVPILKKLRQLNKISFAFKYISAYQIVSQAKLDELETIRRRLRGASNIDTHFYFGHKSNEEIPPNMVSAGNMLTVNYHFQRDLYKFDDVYEYSVAEVIFE